VSPPRVVVVLSVGRCGTQWLTETLRELHPELAVEHEPIGPRYAPRQHFRRWDDPQAILAVPEVAEHLARVERTERYVETGWPLFPAIPLLAERLGPELAIVHLARHPVPSALSHLAHQSYAGSPRADAYTELATLGPEDPNVFQPEYAARWAELTPYERCVFWWTEVSLFALEVAERLPRVPFLRVRSEEMLAGDRSTLERLAAHMGLSADGWAERTRRRVDRWNHRTDADIDPPRIREHPRALEVAGRLGYTLDEVEPAALRERYSGTPDPGLDRIGRWS
jgi:hypothetical protein